MADYQKTYYFPAFPSPYEEAQAKRAEERLAELLAQDRRMAEVRRKHFIEGDYWTQEIIAECKGQNEPVRIMTLINRVTNNNKFPSWKVKVEKRGEILKRITVMHRQGRLERWGRKHVKLPETDEKFKAWLASVSKPLDLPEPMLRELEPVTRNDFKAWLPP